jgi:hypothetical protein
MEERMEDRMQSTSGTNASLPGITSSAGTSEFLRNESLSDQAASFVDKAKQNAQERVRSSVESGKSSAASTLAGVARSLTTAGQQLEGEGSGARDIVQQTAQRIDQAAQFLKSAEIDDLVQRTEDFARRNPALFLAGAFVVGALGARFLKSSRPASTGLQLASGDGHSTFSDREVPRPRTVEEL